jgi:hemoglobin
VSGQPTLFDAIGGHAAVGAAVEEFYRRVLADPDLMPFFAGVPLQRLKAHQAAFFAQALRGPGRYTGRSMREAHAGLGITDAHFDRVAGHLVETLSALGVAREYIEQVIGAVAPLRAEIVTPSGNASAA